MAKANLLVEIFIASVLLWQSVSCLQCFVCNSGVDGECQLSPPPEKYLIECSSEKAPQTQKAKNSSGEAGHAHAHPSELAPPHNEKGNSSSLHDHQLKNRSLRSSPEIEAFAEKSSFLVLPTKLPKEATFCRKVSYHIPEQNNGPESKLPKSLRVVRSCGFLSDENKDSLDKPEGGCKWVGQEAVQMDHCTCHGNGCNFSSQLKSLQVQTLILLSTVTFGYFYIL